MTLNKKVILSLCIFLFASVLLFSQGQKDSENNNTQNNDEEKKEAPLEPELPQIENQDEVQDGDFFDYFFGEEQDTIEPELQKNFTIIDSPHVYDLNPHTASYSSESQIIISLYDGLFSYDPVTLEPQYALAIQHRISRDKKRWTFTLREDIKFSDGSKITATDVKDAWLDLIAEKNAPYSSLLDIVEGAADYRTGKGKRENVGIVASSERTVVVNLVTPTSYFSKILCHSAFAICSKDRTKFSGAFTIKSNKTGEIILEKNENYWDAENTNLEQITILQSEDEDENAHKFNTGSADWITTNVSVQKLLAKDATHINAQFATEFLFFKCRENSIWNNADLRIALLEAVPWEELRSQSLVKATTLVYPINDYPSVEGFSFTDKDEAISRMKEAREKAGLSQDEKLTLTFAILDSEYMKKEAELLIGAWKDLGVDVKIQTTTISRYLSSISTWDADLFSYTWIGDFADPIAFLELFRSDSTLNESKWKNEEYDKLLSEAATYTDDKRTKLLAEAEQLLLDSGLILPISHPVSFNIIDFKSVGGWSLNAFDIHPFKYLYKKQKKYTIPNIVMN